jgi:hypothetical protein
MKTKRLALPLIFIVYGIGIGACDAGSPPTPRAKPILDAPAAAAVEAVIHRNWKDRSLPFGVRLSAAAEERTTHAVRYDAAYLRIPYPMGDVPADQGVCSDEVIRAYRLLGIDLQQLVHEDMNREFHLYPKRWGMAAPDANIDHRRVPNLARFFGRHGQSLPVTDDPADYKPGDVVAWAMPDGRPHIGIVTEQRTGDGARPLVMHNIGLGPHIEDMLFGLKITGHFRYDGPERRHS